MKKSIFLFIVYVVFYQDAYAQCNNAVDYTALRDLYLATDGDNWTKRTGWPTRAQFLANPTPPGGTDMSTWYGIKCNSFRVYEVTLIVNKLSGSIPDFNLPNLQSLSLSSNQLTGSIPDFNLPNLQELNLSFNQLTGPIPDFNLPNLHGLDLDNNQLTGTIPDFNLPNLEGLSLSSNQLTGSIPDFNLPYLIYLNLSNNQLSGNIPSFNSDSLNLNLSYNQLSGCIPQSIKSYCNKSDSWVYLSNNPLLPWQGDFAQFCATDGSQMAQVGAPCDNKNALDGNNDVIQSDCRCGTYDCVIMDTLQVCPGSEIPGLPRPFTYQVAFEPPGAGYYDSLCQCVMVSDTFTGYAHVYTDQPMGLTCFEIEAYVDAQNSLAAPSCDMVMDTFCDLTLLDVGCARMPSPPLVQPAPSPLCEGQGAPHNMSWFAFIAGQGDYTIEIVPFACTTVGNQQGVQAGIYTDCTFTESVACFANPCHTDPIQIQSDAFTPGSTYFFWINGCDGSVCSYKINILGTFVEYTIDEPTEVVCISNECSPICPNNTVELQALTGYENLNATFIWRITSPSGVITHRRTNRDTLNYTVTELGTYTFTIEKINNKCHETSVEKSITILVEHAMVTGGGGCGTCASPCSGPGMGSVANYAARTFLSCWQPNCEMHGPATFTNCFTAMADPTGFLGFANSRQHDGLPSCITTSWSLHPSGNCGTTIPNPNPNVHGVASGFNPEYTGLTANATYVLCVTYTLSNSGCGFDGLGDKICIDRYGNDCMLTASTTVTQPTCGLNNGSISLSPGPAGNTYVWTGGLSGQNPINVPPGTYTVTVTQTATGCTSTATAVVNTSTGITASTIITQPSCGQNNGSITLSPGPAGYTYVWSGGLSGQNPINVPPGTYTVTVTQTATGCTATATSMVNTSSAITTSTIITQPTCGLNNGSISVSPGPVGYTYTWTGGLSGQNPMNLGAGTYTVTVTQTSTGCTATATAVVNTSSAITASTTITQPSCGQNNGSISVSPGPFGYTYAWTGGLSGQNPINVPPGTYTVTVTQTSTGCTGTATAVFNTSTGITASTTVTQPTCGQNNGSISVSPGPAGHTYVWTGGLSGQNPVNVSPGTYTVTVTQTATGCTATATAVVNTSSAITASTTVTQPTCGLNNGSISVSPGPAGYTYAWTGGLSGQNPMNLGAGTYTVTVTEITTGCTSTSSATLLSSNVLTASSSVSPSSCGKNNGAISIIPEGNNYTYSWTGGLSGPSPNAVKAGTYSVTVSETLTGCTAQLIIEVEEEDNSIAAVSDSIYIKEGTTTQINLLANDTYPPDSYTLTLGDLPQEYVELLSFDQSGTLGVAPVSAFSEVVFSTYKLCNKCDECVEATLFYVDERLREIILTTVITPNESNNNRLQFSKVPVQGMEVWIYNRWGQQLHHSTDYQNDWDASGYGGGIYYYVMKVYGLTIKRSLTVIK